MQKIITLCVMLVLAGCTSSTNSAPQEGDSVKAWLEVAQAEADEWNADAALIEAVSYEFGTKAVRSEARSNSSNPSMATHAKYLDANVGDGKSPVWQYKFMSAATADIFTVMVHNNKVADTYTEDATGGEVAIRDFIDSTDVAGLLPYEMKRQELAVMALMGICDAAYWLVVASNSTVTDGYFIPADGGAALGALVCVPGGIMEAGQIDLSVMLGNPDSAGFTITGQYHKEVRIFAESNGVNVPLQQILLTYSNATSVQKTETLTTMPNAQTGGQTFNGRDGEYGMLAEMVQGATAEITVYWCTDGYPIDPAMFNNPACA